MEDAVFEDFVETRYQEEIAYYDGNAKWNQRLYRVFQSYAMLAAVAIPVLLSIDDFRLIIVSGLAASVAGVEAITALFRFHENWVNYRTTAETLKKEIHFYRARVGEYADAPDPKVLFVERVEALISREHTMWLSTSAQSDRQHS